MKTYKAEEIMEAPEGLYWVRRCADAVVIVATVFHSTTPEGFRNAGKRTTIDCGYCSETVLIHGKPDRSDSVEGLVIYGPIEVPEF